jgi:hypothetical protein
MQDAAEAATLRVHQRSAIERLGGRSIQAPEMRDAVERAALVDQRPQCLAVEG